MSADPTTERILGYLDRESDRRVEEHKAQLASLSAATDGLKSAVVALGEASKVDARLKAVEDWRARLDEEHKAARVAWGPILASAIVGAAASGGLALAAWLVLRAAGGG